VNDFRVALSNALYALNASPPLTISPSRAVACTTRRSQNTVLTFLPALYYVVFFPLLFLRLENYKLNLFLFLFFKKK